MQTKIKKQKGFTLVELVVVIAIIAVLTAILIPSIGYVIEHTKETSDMTTVKTLNTVLVEDEARNGKPTLFSEAIKVVENKGYNIEKLTPLSTGDILWDSKNNRFLLRKGTETLYRDNNDIATTDVDLWTVATKETGLSESYSNYLKRDEEFATGLTVFTGLDVGTHSEITSVEYKVKDGRTDAQNVAIITNGVNVTLSVTGLVKSDGSGDIIRHYGKAGEIQIIECAMESFHEYGKVGYVELTKGHYVAESGAKLRAVVVKSENAKVDAIENSIKLAYAETEDIKVKHKGNVELIYNSNAESLNTVKSIAKLCEEGMGTKDDPFLIGQNTFANIQSLDSKAIDDISESGDSVTRRYYKLIEDIDFSTIEWTHSNQQQYMSVNDADINLNGHKILNLDCPLIAAVSYINIHDGYVEYSGRAMLLNCYLMCFNTNSLKTIIVKNINLTGTTTNNTVIAGAAISVKINLENIRSEVSVTADSEKENVGGLIGGASMSTISIKNCRVLADISSEKDTIVAGLVSGTNCTLTVENCAYLGTLKVRNASKAYYCSPFVSDEVNESCKNSSLIEMIN